MWEAHTLRTGTGVHVSSRWMVQCCCCHSNHRAKGGGGGGEGWVLRQERKWHKKRGREKGRVLLKGHSFVVCGRSFGDISDHKRWGKKEEWYYLIVTWVSMKPTLFSFWTKTFLPVLVLPLKLYLYSCSHVSCPNSRGCKFIVYQLRFCRALR